MGFQAALARAAGAFLLFHLGRAARDFRARLHFVRAKMGICQLAQQRLVHERLADLCAKIFSDRSTSPTCWPSRFKIGAFMIMYPRR